MNDFDRTFVLAFYNCFLYINCDKENMLILNTCSFQKISSNLICITGYFSPKNATD